MDLRAAGSRNPGANNAFRLGGLGLGLAVLLVEVLKGLIAARIGAVAAGDLGMAAASVGALAGNVFNPYHRGRGGKGLAMAGGITLGAWPTFLPVVLVVGAAGFLLVRRSGPPTLAIAAAYASSAVIWTATGWSTGWGLKTATSLLWFAIGVGGLLVPRALKDTRHPLKPTHLGPVT